MTKPPLSKGRQLEQIAREIHDLAFDYDEPTRSHDRSDDRIDRIETLAEQLRAVARGPRPAPRRAA